MGKPNAKTRQYLSRVKELYEDDPSLTQKAVCAVLRDEFGLSAVRGRALIVQYRAEGDSLDLDRRIPAALPIKAMSAERLPSSWDEVDAWMQAVAASPQEFAMTMLRILELRNSQSDVAALQASKLHAEIVKEYRTIDGKPEKVLVNRIRDDYDG